METIIQKALKIFLDKFGLDYQVVTVTEDSGCYRANIECDDPSQMIGKNGATLDSLENIFKQIFHKNREEKLFIILDVEEYKKKKEEAVFERVKKQIAFMKESNLPEKVLWPMHPRLRRLVHLWIPQNYPELATDSVGEGGKRSVKVLYK